MIGGMGGGFFGSGASSTQSDSRASQTSQNAEGGSSPVSLSNLSAAGKNGSVNVNMTTHTTNSDYGAIGAAFGFGNDALSFASTALSDTAAFAYDGVSLAADVMNTAAHLNYDGLNLATGLVGDALTQNGQLSLAVLGSSERFADNAALLSLEHSKLNSDVAGWALNAVGRSAADTKALAYDSIREVSNAYGFANQGLLAITSDYSDNISTLTSNSIGGLFNLNQDYMGMLGAVQSDALNQIGSSTQAAQGASLKALDYIYEASKSAEERVITESTKWLIGGIVAVAAVFAFPGLAKVFK